MHFKTKGKWKERKVKSLSHVWLLTTPWIAAHQAPPSIGFSRQEYCSGVPLPSPVCYIYICIWYAYYKSFLLCLVKSWERTSKKERNWKHELNETGALNMKLKKWNRLDRIKAHHIVQLFSFIFLISVFKIYLLYNIVKVKVKSLSRVQLFATPWTVAYQAPPSMGFSRQ